MLSSTLRARSRATVSAGTSLSRLEQLVKPAAPLHDGTPPEQLSNPGLLKILMVSLM